MYGGNIRCEGQDSLETESIQPNSPPGEWLNDDDAQVRPPSNNGKRVLFSPGRPSDDNNQTD